MKRKRSDTKRFLYLFGIAATEINGMADEYTRPDLDSIALVTIDVQEDFLDGGSCEVDGTTAVLPQIARLLEVFRPARLPIV